MRSLDRWLAKLRVPPEGAEPECAESCLEALCDAERVHAKSLGEHEEAIIEAERRRWESGTEPATRA
jgi:hypothetical protein